VGKELCHWAECRCHDPRRAARCVVRLKGRLPSNCMLVVDAERWRVSRERALELARTRLEGLD